MISRAFRPIAAVLSIMLLGGGPVHAGPVAISQVVQVIGSYQNAPDLRLRSLSPRGRSRVVGVKGSTLTSVVQQPAVDGSREILDSSHAASDSLLSGIVVASGDPQRGVEIIDQGEVEGTICDCGEISVPGGGLPKWPLLFLAAIPFFFINTSGDVDTPTFGIPTPPPPPAVQNPTPEVPIPEPGSLLLLGTGLVAFGAGLRRRYATAKLAAQVDNTEECQST